MISSQRRDGVFSFSMQYVLYLINLILNSVNPLLPIIVDNQWRKDSFKGIIIHNHKNLINRYQHLCSLIC
jgi:hypothetical protein